MVFPDYQQRKRDCAHGLWQHVIPSVKQILPKNTQITRQSLTNVLFLKTNVYGIYNKRLDLIAHIIISYIYEFDFFIFCFCFNYTLRFSNFIICFSNCIIFYLFLKCILVIVVLWVKLKIKNVALATSWNKWVFYILFQLVILFKKLFY